MSERIRVKFCGITRQEDAIYAAQLGVDAIGLVFYEKSPRAVTLEQALAAVKNLPPFVSKVGLFVNHEPDQVEQIAQAVGLDLLQFHGDETAEQCERSGRPYIKAVRMQVNLKFSDVYNEYASASGLLLDAYDKSLYGGTGKQFDWSTVPELRKLPIILAGGLSPDNVQQAINTVRPYAVDVSGGIEDSKGVKNKEKMNAFIRGVKSVDR